MVEEEGRISRSQRPAWRRIAREMWYRGKARYCPVCESHVRLFLPAGVDPRPDAKCPLCGSLERHRLVWSFFVDRTDLFDGRPKTMLHVAPEPHISRLIRQHESIDYLSADLEASHAMVAMDVTDIPHPDGHFDVIYCSHVLEHVPEDRMAMRELRRVLAPEGWAVLQVPITAERTFEDPSVTDPAERERLFGQHDHVRRYGPDYEDRLSEAGFDVKTINAVDVVGAENVERLGVMRDEDIYFCTK